MFDSAAVDGWNLLRLFQADSRDPTAQNPVMQTGRQRAHVSAGAQLQESGLASARVHACVRVWYLLQPPLHLRTDDVAPAEIL